MPKKQQSIYVCGPTVYAKVHIGNIRPILTFDIYIRALRALGTKVNFIHNITDIDDKIIKNAQLEKTTEHELATRYEGHYKAMLKLLNIEQPTHMPRVTESLPDIIAFIQKLIATKNAYQVAGNVYFDVTSIPSYGTVSHRKLDELVFEGGRGKHHPADFALWKQTNEGIQFDSPWGKGRPGWHTECAVFVDRFNAHATLDIHGGGIDLLFPHHENENVQYQAFNNIPIAKEWKHVGHINLDGTKMSKSLGNILDAETFIRDHGVDTLRMIFLTTNVTAPLDITPTVIASAKEQVAKFTKAFIQAQAVLNYKNYHMPTVYHVAEAISEWKFANAMKEINAIIKNFNKTFAVEAADQVMALMHLLGFNFTKEMLAPETIALVAKWRALREAEQWAEADLLREELKKHGIV